MRGWDELNAAGYVFEAGPRAALDGTGSALIRDPDGYAIFFDTAAQEILGQA